MGGLIGYATFNAPKSIAHVISTLSGAMNILEDRGYDSAGMCFDVPAKVGTDVVPLVIKSTGKVADIEGVAFEQLVASEIDRESVLVNNAGIGQTRWATHGRSTIINSHPHVSDDMGEFVVVHSGVITNFMELKTYLSNKGVEFMSDTDTEVVPKLYKFLYDQHGAKRVSFPQLTMKMMTHLTGTFALLVKSTHYPNEIIGVKNGRSLFFGCCTKVVDQQDVGPAGASARPSLAVEAYIASDVEVINPYADKVTALQNNDVVHVVNGSYDIYNTASLREDRKVDRSLHTLEVQTEQSMKGGMVQKEVDSQPDAVPQTDGDYALELNAASGMVKLGGEEVTIDEVLAMLGTLTAAKWKATSLVGTAQASSFVIFRSEDDEWMHKARDEQAFTFPPEDRQYQAGRGGRYFSTTFDDARKSSKDCNNMQHFFMCGIPTPGHQVTLTLDNIRDFNSARTPRDTLFHDVPYGGVRRTEYVKVGPQDGKYTPEWMILFERL